MSDKINIKYLFDNNYNPEYVNGVYGGVAPTGELVLHFYNERTPLPNEMEIELDENGELTDNVVVIDPETFKMIRSVRCGVTLNKENATSLYFWLEQRLIEMGVDINELRTDNAE